MDDQWGVRFIVVGGGGGGGGGEIVQLHEVEHVGLDGCVEGVGREGEVSDGVAVHPRTAGRWVRDRVGD